MDKGEDTAVKLKLSLERGSPMFVLQCSMWSKDVA